jgi:hypothetical protein
MSDARADDVIDAQEAARLLEVTSEQIPVMVDEGILTPVDDGRGATGFARSEVMAARLMGG